jgi:hypothetical protein
MDKRAQVQNRTFLNWINNKLKEKGEKVEELAFDDGEKLCILLGNSSFNKKEILSKKQIKYTKSPKIKIHKISNIKAALEVKFFVKKIVYDKRSRNSIN